MRALIILAVIATAYLAVVVSSDDDQYWGTTEGKGHRNATIIIFKI